MQLIFVTNNYAQQRGGLLFLKGSPPPTPTPIQMVDISDYRNRCGDPNCQIAAIKCGATFENPYIIPKKNLSSFIVILNSLCNAKNQQTNVTANYPINKSSSSTRNSTKSSGNYIS